MPEINLVRLGHYHTPSGGTDNEGNANGSCRTALVVDNRKVGTVGLAVWNYNGGQETRSDVVLAPPSESQDTFHLSGDCPWKR